jgi:hypothetical protein
VAGVVTLALPVLADALPKYHPKASPLWIFFFEFLAGLDEIYDWPGVLSGIRPQTGLKLGIASVECVSFSSTRPFVSPRTVTKISA